MAHETSSTHQRALALNLDHSAYGTIAEIGAGQEVARWLFRVGGAAGTVAKTISAYDMTVSDQVYGDSGRYVSRQRLVAMLDHEYKQLMERLGADPDSKRRLFAFADTISARNYKGTNECHGWMGIRFQRQPGDTPHDILLHLNLRDNENLLQQEAVGILGINLIFGAYHHASDVRQLLETLHTELAGERIEIDVVHLAGAAFENVDVATVGLQLVRQGLAPAVVLQGDELVPPTELARKRAIVMKRILFQESRSDIAARLIAGHDCLLREFQQLERPALAMTELSVNPIRPRATVSEEVYLERLRELAELEHPVLLTRLAENYELTSYLRRYSQEPLRFVFGASNLAMVLAQEFYTELAGGLVEGIGKLFADNVKMYILPMRRDAFFQHLRAAGVDESLVSVEEGDIVEASTLRFKEPLGHLYRYLIDMQWVVTVAGAAPSV